MIEKIIRDLEVRYAEKPHRLDHVYGVRDTALKLGKKYNCNLEWLEIAALLHDITKYESYEYHIREIQSYFDHADEIIAQYNPKILHAFSAAVVASTIFHVENEEILNAIMHHTIGRPKMSIYEEIIFISDYIEPNRTYKSCVKARKKAKNSLNNAIYQAIDDSIRFHEKEGSVIPQIAYEARDYYYTQREETK